ncbi:Xylose isomerase-like TIM barrel [Botrimarina colliarenosi]|uniref:Xylose isomerase-like TIM barrel n=1 Tax=Botrimarina colliarenosi TaxID=2528001 RepID=A0A5C6AKE0_9BACT|nr:sugar phosphate isomerase/epimerase family protein [Botrimarina colliarenosi]TWU00515.1 Xylose isomerase-like TIM barrel [Botrimarina colliarenosi]
MLTPSIGVQTRSLRQPLRRALATAAELGAVGVEIDLRTELSIADFSQTALRQFRKLLNDLGLRVLAASFPTRRGFDEPEDLERRVMATREAMAFAYKLGAGVVIGRAGELPDEDDAPLSDTLVQSLQLLGAHGERVGARFAFASGAPVAAQRKLLDRVGDGAVGVALHPALLIGGGVEPVEAATRLGPDTLHVHAVDAVREASIAGGRATEVQLGRGEADFPALLAVLEEHGYRGPITIERNDTKDPVGEIGDAMAYLRSLGG